MLKHIKIFFLLFICSFYLTVSLSVNEKVYSKDYEYNGEEFINVTVYEKINPAIVLVWFSRPPKSSFLPAGRRRGVVLQPQPPVLLPREVYVGLL